MIRIYGMFMRFYCRWRWKMENGISTNPSPIPYKVIIVITKRNKRLITLLIT